MQPSHEWFQPDKTTNTWVCRWCKITRPRDGSDPSKCLSWKEREAQQEKVAGIVSDGVCQSPPATEKTGIS